MRTIIGTFELLLLSVIETAVDTTCTGLAARVTALGHSTSNKITSTVLNNLARRGAVKTNTSPKRAMAGGRRRLLYSLTDVGTAELEKHKFMFLEAWNFLPKVNPENGKILLKIDPEVDALSHA